MYDPLGYDRLNGPPPGSPPGPPKAEADCPCDDVFRDALAALRIQLNTRPELLSIGICLLCGAGVVELLETVRDCLLASCEASGTKGRLVTDN